MRTNLLSYWGWIALAAMLAGCGDSGGPRTYKVTGEVTLDGQPLPTEGTIILHHVPPDQDAASAQIIDGEFSLRATEGQKRIEVHASREVPGETNAYGSPLVEPYIPQKYNANSVLAAEVSATEENHFVFDLTTAE